MLPNCECNINNVLCEPPQTPASKRTNSHSLQPPSYASFKKILSSVSRANPSCAASSLNLLTSLALSPIFSSGTHSAMEIGYLKNSEKLQSMLTSEQQVRTYPCQVTSHRKSAFANVSSAIMGLRPTIRSTTKYPASSLGKVQSGRAQLGFSSCRGRAIQYVSIHIGYIR